MMKTPENQLTEKAELADVLLPLMDSTNITVRHGRGRGERDTQPPVLEEEVLALFYTVLYCSVCIVHCNIQYYILDTALCCM